MKIALLAPFYYSLEQKSDGGIETFLYHLADELVKRDHEVDVFTVSDSSVAGNIIPIFEKSTTSVADDPYIRQSREIAGSVKTFRRLAENNPYDVVHNNQINCYAHLSVALVPNAITTLHSPPDYYPIQQAKDIDPIALSRNIVAISDFQRTKPGIGFIDRVYNGIDANSYTFNDKAESYAAWMGRLIPQKGITETIRVANELGIALQFAGSKWDEQFYRQTMQSAQTNSAITFLGHADTAMKNQLLGKARVFIFPSHYEEFGYVRVEALACGTPVVTYDLGAAREIVKDGVTGFVCPPHDIEALKQAVMKIYAMPEAEYQEMRRACRAHFETNFTTSKMIDGYEAIYQKIASSQ